MFSSWFYLLGSLLSCKIADGMFFSAVKLAQQCQRAPHTGGPSSPGWSCAQWLLRASTMTSVTEELSFQYIFN